MEWVAHHQEEIQAIPEAFPELLEAPTEAEEVVDHQRRRMTQPAVTTRKFERTGVHWRSYISPRWKNQLK